MSKPGVEDDVLEKEANIMKDVRTDITKGYICRFIHYGDLPESLGGCPFLVMELLGDSNISEFRKVEKKNKQILKI